MYIYIKSWFFHYFLSRLLFEFRLCNDKHRSIVWLYQNLATLRQMFT